MENFPEQIVDIGKIMFERHLTDIAGGNISVRDGDIIYLSPRYAGHKWHWQLTPKDIVSGQLNNDDICRNPSLSREGLSHIMVYRAFAYVNVIIHAHPFYVQPFCAAEKPIQPALYYLDRYGEIGFIERVPNYSQEQADRIVVHLRRKTDLMKDAAAAVLMPAKYSNNLNSTPW